MARLVRLGREGELRRDQPSHAGVQARVWKELGLKNRFQLRRLMKKYGLSAAGDGGPDR